MPKTFQPDSAREKILALLDEAKCDLAVAASALKAMDMPARSGEALDLAQRAAGLGSLLEQDWDAADREGVLATSQI